MYDDHVAAGAAAEQRGARIAGLATWAHVEGENMPNDTLGFDLGLQRGFAAGVKAARDAVEKQATEFLADDDRVGHSVMQYALAAIDALEKP